MIAPIARLNFLKLGAAASAGLAALPQTSIAAEASPRQFRFVHLTDIHLQPELDAERGFRQCIAHVNELRPRPDFVITGGDLLMDALEVDKARTLKLWKMYEECCRDFEMPVYNTIGNHDIVGWSSKGLVTPDDVDYGNSIARRIRWHTRGYANATIATAIVWNFISIHVGDSCSG